MGVTFAAIAAIVFNKSNKHRVYPHREQEKTHKHNVDPTKREHTDWNLSTRDNQENTGAGNNLLYRRNWGWVRKPRQLTCYLAAL